MVVQLFALLGLVALVYARERTRYNQQQQSIREQARQERDAQQRLRTRTSDVTVAPLDVPASVHPIEWARARRFQRDGRPAA